MTDTPGWKRHGRALLWSLGAALTAAATAYASWLLMTIASLYTAPSPFEAKAKSDQARVAELAATLAPPAAPFAAPPPPQQQRQAPQDAALSPQRQSPQDAALSRGEVREIQKRLASLGFDPGRLDGRAGLRTEEAARRYRLARSEADTGAVVDRSLLEALRRDPTPPLPPGQAAPPNRAPPAANPILASIKSAGDRLARWLNSIGR